MGHSFGGLSIRHQRFSRVEVRLRKIRFEPQRFQTVRQGLFGSALPPQHVGQIVVNIGVTGLKPQSRRVMRDGFVESTLPGQGDTQIELVLGLGRFQPDGFGVVGFSSGFVYGYAGYSDGRGAFDYAIRDASNDLLQIWTSYDAAGAGRLRVTYTRFSDGATGGFNQCFDTAGCLVYVSDPYNFTGHCATAPCVVGDLAACATVPAPPF